MNPNVVAVSDWSNLVQSIESARIRRAESRHGVERNQTSGQVLLHCGFKRFATQLLVASGFELAHFDSTKQASALNR